MAEQNNDNTAEIENDEKIRLILNNAIKVKIVHISDCVKETYEMFRDYCGDSVNAEYLKNVFDEKLVAFISELKTDLYVVIEVPYVDRVYRDTYYNYYSTKHHKHLRDCCRISFFDAKIDNSSFYFENVEKTEKVDFLNTHYMGYLVIRPTFPKIIGRSLINPKARLDTRIISICDSNRYSVTVDNIKLNAKGFPHCSQDSEMITCAETTIWAIMDYFGNKYPEYRPALPSTIHQSLRRFSFKRQVPSSGLTMEQVSYSLREFGFSTKIYRNGGYKHAPVDKTFLISLSIYIESGIPVVVGISDDIDSHAANIIGITNYKANNSELFNNPGEANLVEDTTNIYDYHSFNHEFVFIDDNFFPYKISQIEDAYFKEKMPEAEFEFIVVPLYPKIYLDAPVAHRNAQSTIRKSQLINLNENEKYIIRTYLASSRSYKNYVNTISEMHNDLKTLIGTLPMPKFIWITEISTMDDFKKGICESLIIQDATQPIDATDDNKKTMTPLMAVFDKGKYWNYIFAKWIELSNVAADNKFKVFNNLR